MNRKENAATRAAALVIPTVGDNRRRHDRLQQFMLANDSVALAVEVPIWLTDNDITALETKHGIELASPTGDGLRVITGHMDFLQVRNGAVHILDYKPDAVRLGLAAQGRQGPQRAARPGLAVSGRLVLREYTDDDAKEEETQKTKRKK